MAPNSFFKNIDFLPEKRIKFVFEKGHFLLHVIKYNNYFGGKGTDFVAPPPSQFSSQKKGVAKMNNISSDETVH